jgi:HCOMODA/2-hydroxy-3-carboxy-muconic semialdehyde decarboxylase
MSKLFEVLARLEGQEANGAVPVPTAIQAPVPAPRIAPLPARIEASLSTAASRPAAVQHRRPATPPKGNRIVAIAFDLSMVLIALAVFIAICYVSSGAIVLTLMHNLPWLGSMLIGLAVLYWLLSAILTRETPGMYYAGGQTSQSHQWSSLGELVEPTRKPEPPSASHRPHLVGMLKRPLIDELAIASRILTNEGVVDAYGSVSVRDDNNPTRMFLAGASIGDYDLNGNPANGDLANAHPERFIHAEIYRARPDVMAIVHSRASELIPFAASTVPLLPISQMAGFLNQGVPVFESRQVGNVSDLLLRARSLGQALAETLGDKTAVLMRGQGAVVVGPQLHVAVGRAYYMNLNARLQAQAILLGGTVNYLDAGESSAVSPANEFEPAWEFWKQKIAM